MVKNSLSLETHMLLGVLAWMELTFSTVARKVLCFGFATKAVDTPVWRLLLSGACTTVQVIIAPFLILPPQLGVS